MWTSHGRSLLKRAPSPRANGRRFAAVALALTSLAVIPPVAHSAEATSRLSAFDAVDPFIGTRLDPSQNKGNSAYGNTWPGATVPFGMVQSSPATFRSSDGDQKGGYEYTADKLRGFGMTRLSGTGCEGRFSGFDFPLLPYTGPLPGGALPTSPAGSISDYYLGFDHSRERAAPGYYSVTTDNDVTAELTASTRTAVSSFDFPKADSSTLILDVAGSNNRVFGSEVTVRNSTTVEGWVEAASICDEGGRYRAYFSATFDKPIRSHGTWEGGNVIPGSATARAAEAKHGAGAYLVFDKGAKVTSKVGLSYVSIAGAAQNAAHEVSSRDDFDNVREAAEDTWRDALDTVRIDGGTKDERTKFYTALYHALLHPNTFDDVNGEYPGYDGKVHKVTKGRHHYVTYAGWDSYRSQAQLVALLFPKVGSDINQSITDMVKQSGKWPNWPHLNQLQQKMSGDSLQSLLSSVDAFGSTDYDRRAALESMKATQTLPADRTLRRHGYQYMSVGFIENRKADAATSKTLEYAVNDFGIAQLAKRLGDRTAYDRYMTRAQNWQNVFDEVSRHIRPRDRNGFDRGFNLGERGDQFEQATGWQYGWMVPHNVGTLIDQRGGQDISTLALDEHLSALDAGVYNTRGAYLSNQPSFAAPYVYHWLRQPNKAREVLNRASTQMYNTTPSGLPGNDDLGSLSSWYVWANVGLYPAIPGTADLVVSGPRFDRVVIDSADSRRRIVIDAEGASTKPYVTEMKVDGRSTTRSWLNEDFTRKGGDIRLTTSTRQGTWGARASDVPPSHTDGSNARNNVGTTPDGAGNTGSLDVSDNSLSRERLAAAGAAPGGRIPHGDTGVTFTWPKSEPGQPDNWIPHGQRIDMGDVRATGVSFLGLATNGPSQGSAIVEYTDGSTQEVGVQFTDWTPGTTYQFGNTPLVTTVGRNRAAGGSDTVETKVFGTVPRQLDPAKRVASVVLPRSTDRGIMHIFDVALTTKQGLEVPGAVPERTVLTPTGTPHSSQAVTWRTGAAVTAGEVRFRKVGDQSWRTGKARSNDELVSAGIPTRTHSAVMNDLRPGTTYEYQVGTGRLFSPTYSFTSAERPGEDFTFLYFGDAQNDLASRWAPVVKQAYERYPDAAGSVNAGDLVNTSGNDSEWRDWFGAMNGYSQTSNVIAAPGNHEYSGDAFLRTWKSTFEFPANGPRADGIAGATPAERQRSVYEAHMAKVIAETAYYTDYQGVRFLTLNASTGDARSMMTPPWLPACSQDCPDPEKLWLDLQGRWLDHALKSNPNKWAVAVFHQPVFSAAEGRDEKPVRDAWLPVFQRNDIDLVLMGHDHVYSRGYVDEDATDTPGLTTGPVYTVAVSGPKYYELAPENESVWKRNGATEVVRAGHTSTFQGIKVTGNQLRYEAVIAAKWDDHSTTDKEVGDVLDSFTITKYDDGKKYVTEDGVPVPGRPRSTR
jgi:predicted alpha-1,2-mannosidase